ncbi:MAG: nitrate reductase subunit beta, partial [Lautropia sp.]|nr:nitrate reductase subunit beta [Lautropia sp.]
WQSGKAEKCLFCYPRIEAGQPTVCSETCVGRIRYLGVMLYDADRIEAAASVPDEKQLYKAQLECFLDPHDPAVIEAARKEGIPDTWLEAARQSPVYRMACQWEVALPLHPEYRTLPMVWYIPPLSPIQGAAENRQMPHEVVDGSIIPDVKSLRIPVRYLANLLTAGDEAPVVRALERMIAMRAFKRSEMIEGRGSEAILQRVGLDAATVEDMYQTMAIANYEDRFVIPTTHKAAAERDFSETGACGFSFGNGCSSGYSRESLFGKKNRGVDVIHLQLKRPRSEKALEEEG